MFLKDLAEIRPRPSYGEVARISLDVAKRLLHLHKNRIRHYDVKPANILLDERRNAKLADFACLVFKMSSLIYATRRGPLGYMTLECIQGGATRLRLRAGRENRHVQSGQGVDELCCWRSG
ncbi:unnamed protein product [Ostreobium quekettii]|uniref:Protein kinase domain-containing protein n=1 Tax=Ostreobium quekettii TaxID=121088 RepID=A0A8S1IXD4_9CHLO|nr:unnamed protein product [Ostreobium quekettii]